MGDVENQFFDALNHELRRALLREVCRSPNESCDLEDVIVATKEALPESPPIERVELGCYHHHLPKLDTAGLISYNWEKKEIAYEGACDPEELRRVLQHDPQEFR